MHKVIFLDRDGTLNSDSGKPVFRIADWQWVDGALEGLRLLRDHGFVLAVVTNQTGIGAGLYTEPEMQTLHEYMREELLALDIELAAVAYCPHIPGSGCGCEKPATGMAQEVAAAIGPIDYNASWMIGDKEKDILFGQAIGAQTALIRSSYWTADSLKATPTLVVDSLLDFAQRIVRD